MNTHGGARSPRVYLFYVLLPLVLVVCASVVTVYIAVQYADQPVGQSYNKNGLVISANNENVQRATILGIEISLHCFDDGRAELVFASKAPHLASPAQLQLQFTHAFDSTLDKTFYLSLKTPNRYPVNYSQLASKSGRWQVVNEEQRWILPKAAWQCDKDQVNVGAVERMRST